MKALKAMVHSRARLEIESKANIPLLHPNDTIVALIKAVEKEGVTKVRK